MPYTRKIELFKRYHSEMPCKVCPKQSAAYPETVKPDPRGHILHSIMQPCGLVKPYAIQFATLRNDRNSRNRYRPEPEPTAEPCRPNQPGTIAPNRSSLQRSARAGFFAALRSGDCAAGSLLPYYHARKCFLRFFCADFCELRLMLISCNS